MITFNHHTACELVPASQRAASRAQRNAFLIVGTSFCRATTFTFGLSHSALWGPFSNLQHECLQVIGESFQSVLQSPCSSDGVMFASRTGWYLQQSILVIFPVAATHIWSRMDPPPCFTAGKVFFSWNTAPLCSLHAVAECAACLAVVVQTSDTGFYGEATAKVSLFPETLTNNHTALLQLWPDSLGLSDLTLNSTVSLNLCLLIIHFAQWKVQETFCSLRVASSCIMGINKFHSQILAQLLRAVR